MRQRERTLNTGFALVETVLILIIIGIIAGVGYWVATQRNSSSSANSSTATPATTTVTAKSGTLGAIDQLTKADSQAETGIDTKYQTGDQSAATSSDSTV